MVETIVGVGLRWKMVTIQYKLVMCSGQCVTVGFGTTCPPIELRTGLHAELPCTCSNNFAMLNCNTTILPENECVTLTNKYPAGIKNSEVRPKTYILQRKYDPTGDVCLNILFTFNIYGRLLNLPKIAGLLKSLRQASPNAKYLLLDCGYAAFGTSFYKYFGMPLVIEGFKIAGYSASGFGNHNLETFMEATEVLTDNQASKNNSNSIIKNSPTKKTNAHKRSLLSPVFKLMNSRRDLRTQQRNPKMNPSSFSLPIVSVNVRGPNVVPSIVIDIGGYYVGIIGYSVSPIYNRKMVLTRLTEEAIKLRGQGLLIILISHGGKKEVIYLSQKLKLYVDVILGGHTHTTYSCNGQNHNLEQSVPVIHAGYNALHYGHIEIIKKGNNISISSNIHGLDPTVTKNGDPELPVDSVVSNWVKEKCNK